MPFAARAIIFDLDGTLTPVASPWRFVHEHYGVWDQAVAWHDAFFAGEIDYETWCEKDAALWNGRDMAEVDAVLEQIQPTPEALAVLAQVATHDADNGPLALMILSSGFGRVARRVVAQAGLPVDRIHIVANGIREENGGFVGETNVILDHPEKGKRAHVARFLAQNGIAPNQAIAVDDRLDDRTLFDNLGDFVHIRTPQDLFRVLEYLR